MRNPVKIKIKIWKTLEKIKRVIAPVYPRAMTAL